LAWREKDSCKKQNMWNAHSGQDNNKKGGFRGCSDVSCRHEQYNIQQRVDDSQTDATTASDQVQRQQVWSHEDLRHDFEEHASPAAVHSFP